MKVLCPSRYVSAIVVLVAVLSPLSTTALAAGSAGTAAGTILFSEDWESGTIDPLRWTVWGSPQPSLYAAAGRDGSYAVNNNGDGMYASGLFVSNAFDITQGLTIEFWLRGYGPLGHFWSGNDVGLTLCDPSVNHEHCGNWLAVIVASAEANKVLYDAYVEGGMERTIETWAPLADQWHKYRFTITSDGLVSFFRDDELKLSTVTPIDLEASPQAWLQIQGRSVGAYYYVDDVVVTEVEVPPTPVQIDAKPGSSPNCTNMNGKGVVPVAVLGSDDLDVSQIDVSTLEFGGLHVRTKGKGDPQCSVEDVSGDFTSPEGAADGYPDLVCQFEDDLSAWSPDNGTATLTGTLLPEYGGAAIVGTDEVCLRPK